MPWWAQLGSNQRPLACQDCHRHSPDLRLVLWAQVRTEQVRAQPSTTERPRAKCAPNCAPMWPISYQGQRCLLFIRGRKVLPLPSLRGVPSNAVLWHGPRYGRAGGRCIMSRSGVFYAVKAMERVAAGTTGTEASGVAPGRAVANDARAAASPDCSASSIVLRCWRRCRTASVGPQA